MQLAQINDETLLILIQQAQSAMWDIDESDAELTYCRTDLDTKEIYKLWLNLLPDTPEAEHYRHCNSCKRAILAHGNYVVVNADGTLDSIMFPAMDIADEYKTEWTKFLERLNVYVTQHRGEPRRITGIVCTPFDGGLIPKSHRGSDHMHFNIVFTPRSFTSARKLCKHDAAMKSRLALLVKSEGFNDVNLNGILAMHGEQLELDERTFIAVYNAALVLSVVENVESPVHRHNIMFVACNYVTGFLDFPLSWLPALDSFESTGDLEALVAALTK